MTVSNNSTCISTCLFEREIGLSSQKNIQKAIEKQIVQNVVNDRFKATETRTTVSQEALKSLARCGAFVAVQSGNAVGLWNIISAGKVWECIRNANPKYPDRNMQPERLLVDEKGLVVQVYKVDKSGALSKYYIETYFQGNFTGSTSFQNVNKFMLSKGHLFGVGSTKVIDFDTRTQTDKTYELEASEESWEVKSIALAEDRLLIGSVNDITWGSNKPKNPRISILDLSSGKIENHFFVEKMINQISSFFVNKNQLIYIGYEGRDIKKLWSMDLLTGGQEKISDIPAKHRCDHLSVVGHLLTACFSNFSQPHIQKCRSVIDLNIKSEIKRIEYKGSIDSLMSFHRGVLLIPYIFENGVKFFTENFYSSLPEYSSELSAMRVTN